jgi:hypothetical protein
VEGTPFNVWETSFSNSVCNTAFCLRQSYPGVYPTDNLPREGSSRLLPGLCGLGNLNLMVRQCIQLKRSLSIQGNALLIRFYDQLYQPNAADQRCDESWSLDNLKVRLHSY